MRLPEFIRSTNLSDSLLFGFYGGGNYGDELLLEVLSNALHAGGHRNISIAYQTPDTFATFHHDFDYPRIPMHDKMAIIRTIFKKKHIIIGGGGLWGMDTNANIFLLSLMLFISRIFLGKKVYLLNVGYYKSATWLGRMSAWLAGKAANLILARDAETYANFQRICRNTEQDTDMALYISNIDLAPYEEEAAKLRSRLPLRGKTIFITLRRFRSSSRSRFTEAVSQFIADNTDKHIILALMEPESVDPEGWTFLYDTQRQYPHVQITDFSCNPLALFLWFREHASQLLYIGPQFHGMITAYLNGVPLLPVSYDNKVTQLLEGLDYKHIIPIREVNKEHLQTFADRYY